MNALRLRWSRALAGAALVALPAAAQDTPPAVWAASYDVATRTRHIPLELILGARWDGSREPTLPKGRFVEALMRGGAQWTGPSEWRHRDTGEMLMVYERLRPGVGQKMAVRRAGDAIGRVEDNRNDSTCDQEAKFPIGRWTQGDTRTFEYACWFGREGSRRRIEFVATITIEEIDYAHGGADHSLRLRWILKRRADGREMDHKVYVFSPGLSLVSAQ